MSENPSPLPFFRKKKEVTIHPHPHLKPLYSKSFLQSTSTSLLIINPLHSRVAHRSFDLLLPSFSLLRDLQNRNSLEIDFHQSNITGDFYGYWSDDARVHTHCGLYTVKKDLTIISFGNKTDTRVYSTVFMIDGNLFSARFDFEGHVVVKMTVSLLRLMVR